MNVFEAVKQSVTTRQAAEHYGIRVGRNGMCVCPFHDDKNPSMKVDRRFHCFGCQADGDVIDFVSRLENVSPKEAALMLAQDFSIPYEDREPPGRSRRPPAPAGKPGTAIQTHGAVLLPGTVRLSQSAAPLEAGLCPQDAGGRMAPAFRGSLAETIPCGISAGCAAVLRHRGTCRPDCQLRKGSEEP